MDFGIDIASAFHAVDGIAIIDGGKLLEGTLEYKVLDAILPKLGLMSQEAQGLPAPVTTTAARLKAGNHKLYLALAKGTVVLGLLKTGPKMLSIYDRKAHIHQRAFVSLLDFYVNAACRRQGIGMTMFQAMLEEEAKTEGGAKGAWEIAYDRPSKLCLSFLKKHFGLEKYVEQPNNYVVFDDYFEIIERDEKGVLGIEEKVYGDSPSGIAQLKTRHFRPLETSVLPTVIPNQGKEGKLMQTTYGSTFGSIDDAAPSPPPKSPYGPTGYLSKTQIDVFGYPSECRRELPQKNDNRGTLDTLKTDEKISPYERTKLKRYGTKSEFGTLEDCEINDGRVPVPMSNNVTNSTEEIRNKMEHDDVDDLLKRSYQSDYTLNYTMGPDADRGFNNKQKELDATLVASARQLGKCSSLSSPSLMRTHMNRDSRSYLQ